MLHVGNNHKCSDRGVGSLICLTFQEKMTDRRFVLTNFCLQRNNPLLVYEFLPTEDNSVLSWLSLTPCIFGVGFPQNNKCSDRSVGSLTSLLFEDEKGITEMLCA